MSVAIEKARLSKLGVALLLGAVAGPAVADGVARIEYYPVPSMTLDDNAFLSGRRGDPTVLAGALKIPTKGDDRLPAMVVLHGSSGVGGTDSLTDYERKFLNSMGIATFVIDSFSARGITQTLTDQSQLGRLQMAYDSYRALELLSEHPRIDPERIGVLGVSRGAAASLFSAVSRFEDMHGADNGAIFALHVGFSTPCARRYLDREEVTGRPILLLHGEADDIASPGACREYVDEIVAAGADATLISYDGAPHAFDSPTIPSMVLESAQNASGCRVGESSQHVVIDLDTEAPFSWNSSCVEHGFTIGYDAAASEAAYRDLGAFLQENFRLE